MFSISVTEFWISACSIFKSISLYNCSSNLSTLASSFFFPRPSLLSSAIRTGLGRPLYRKHYGASFRSHTRSKPVALETTSLPVEPPPQASRQRGSRSGQVASAAAVTEAEVPRGLANLVSAPGTRAQRCRGSRREPEGCPRSAHGRQRGERVLLADHQLLMLM